MSGDWTLLTKAAAALFVAEADRNTWHALSAKARNRLALTDVEIAELAELNHQLGAVIRFKFREGHWQFGYLGADKTTFTLVPDIWRRLPLHIDPFGASLTWDGKTFFPVLVRDAKPTEAPGQASEQSSSAVSPPKGKPGRPPGAPERERVAKLIRTDLEKKTHVFGLNRSGGLTLVELLSDGKTGDPMPQVTLESRYKADRGTLRRALKQECPIERAEMFKK